MYEDPLLSGNIRSDYQNLRLIDEDQKRIAQRYEELKKQQVEQISPAHQTQNPVWDEIDSIVAGMSDQEIAMLNANEEYMQSSNAVNGILQREYLNIMRPLVERTPDGKEALNKHLELIKRLRKTAKDQINQKYSLLDEYMQNHSDIPFNEFIEMKKSSAPKKQPSKQK